MQTRETVSVNVYPRPHVTRALCALWGAAVGNEMVKTTMMRF